MRPVLFLHQIELSSICNLRCPYCPHGFGNFARPKMYMSMEVFEKALQWIRKQFPTQNEINLAGTGESSLNPDFAKMILRAREVLGPSAKILFATNGVGKHWKQELVDAIKPADPRIWVSLHQPALAAYAVKMFYEAKILESVSVDAVMNPNDWAGQVDWIKPGYRIPCQWQQFGKAFVTSNGDILTCCLDLTGESQIGSVLDEPHDLQTAPWRICKACYQDVGG